jgi:hypothetical protein
VSTPTSVSGLTGSFQLELILPISMTLRHFPTSVLYLAPPSFRPESARDRHQRAIQSHLPPPCCWLFVHCVWILSKKNRQNVSVPIALPILGPSSTKKKTRRVRGSARVMCYKVWAPGVVTCHFSRIDMTSGIATLDARGDYGKGDRVRLMRLFFDPSWCTSETYDQA